MLRTNGNSGAVKGSQKADVYAFAIILYEIIGRRGPFGLTPHEPKGIYYSYLFCSILNQLKMFMKIADIIERVKRFPMTGEEVFRPNVKDLNTETAEECVVNCMKECWTENPEARPEFPSIRSKLKKMKGGR